MSRRYCFILFALLTVGILNGQSFREGEVLGPFIWKSTVYPGTIREYMIYVPSQYNEDRAACLTVVQDGLGVPFRWSLPRVLDSLIALKAIPVTIGVFVMPGRTLAENEESAYPRINRSVEYDAVDDTYAQFLIEEFLPTVTKEYNLIDDPSARLIAGSSSGGIASFIAAWHRPDYFGRVLSGVGSFTNLRGGYVVDSWIRKWEHKPLRIFLQDGTNDLNNFSGSWWLANQGIYTALKWSGYEVRYHWDDTGHGATGLAKVIPEALTWLWQDDTSNPQPNGEKIQFGIDEEPWGIAYRGQSSISDLGVNSKGEVFFIDNIDHQLRKIQDPEFAEPISNTKKTIIDLDFDPKGNLWLTTETGGVLVYDSAWKPLIAYPDQDIIDLMTSSKYAYALTASGEILRKNYTDEAFTMIASHAGATALGTNAEQTFLTVTASKDKYAYSYKVTDQGLADKQRYTLFESHPLYPYCNASAIVTDRENRQFIFTNVGIQITSQLGRITNVVTVPKSEDTISSSLIFGGPTMHTLFMKCGPTIYQRKLNTHGLISSQDLVIPPKPPHSRMNSLK